MIRSRPYVGTRRIILASGVGMFVFVSWASFAQVDEVTRGQGRVIPSSKAQIVQSAEPATILDIVVRSGQPVRKGQLLVPGIPEVNNQKQGMDALLAWRDWCAKCHNGTRGSFGVTFGAPKTVAVEA